MSTECPHCRENHASMDCPVLAWVSDHRASRPDYSKSGMGAAPRCPTCGRPTHYNGVRWVHDEDDKQ